MYQTNNLKNACNNYIQSSVSCSIYWTRQMWSETAQNDCAPYNNREHWTVIPYHSPTKSKWHHESDMLPPHGDTRKAGWCIKVSRYNYPNQQLKTQSDRLSLDWEDWSKASIELPGEMFTHVTNTIKGEYLGYLKLRSSKKLLRLRFRRQHFQDEDLAERIKSNQIT